MSIYKHIGNEIRRLRMERRSTQDALAKALDVSTNTVSRWETGVYKIAIDDLDAVATLFRVHISDLLPHETPPTPNERLLTATAGLDDDDMRQLIEYAAFLARRRKDV